MKNLVLLAVVIGVAQAVSLAMLDQDDEWEAFKAKHGKTYVDEVEEKFRKMIFMENLQRIAKHNKRSTTFKQGTHEFSDMLPTEFRKIMNGYRQDLRNRTANARVALAASLIKGQNDTPQSVDWRQQGAVTPVKNQQQCGSCWSFSATGALEGQTFLSTGNLVSLSEQNLIDCSGSYGNNGCGGGLQDNAFQYIKANGGIDTESNYPYEAQDGNCRYQSSNSGAEDTGYTDLPQGDEGQLQQATANIGPISVAIDASHDSFNDYSSGVYSEPDCSSSNLDHAVLVVGYGTDPNQGDYWLVKNSWGESWGEQGYIRMSRNNNNNCGIASEASYPTV